MANEALFNALAEAESRPSRGLRTFQNAVGAVTAPIEGYNAGKQAQAQLLESRLKPYEIFTNLSKAIGPEAATKVLGNAGLKVPDMGTGSSSDISQATPDQLMNMGDFGKSRLEMQKTAQGIDIAGPKEPKAYKASITQSGLISPEAFDAWSQSNMDQNGMIPAKNADYLEKALGLKSQAARGNAMTGRVTNMQLNQLPSQMGPNSAAGAAYQVKVAARQGKSLIAKASTPQALALASADLSRAVQRAAPVAETIGAGNFAQSLPTLWSQFQQKISADPNGPDVPKMRKALYDQFDELDKAASPWIANHLQNLEESGFTPQGWNGIKQREMGLNIPDIPFDAGNGSAQNPNVATGIPDVNSAKAWLQQNPNHPQANAVRAKLQTMGIQ